MPFSQRQVSAESGRQAAVHLNAIFAETSSLSGQVPPCVCVCVCVISRIPALALSPCCLLSSFLIRLMIRPGFWSQSVADVFTALLERCTHAFLRARHPSPSLSPESHDQPLLPSRASPSLAERVGCGCFGFGCCQGDG